ncbi:MAG: glutamate--tRNA ligase [Ruminococcaceae bacterium]|nr:glutamate--tRNA ligase [Oscillospiraceae bacterium]
MDYNALAELLLPNITKTPQDYEKIYPRRNGGGKVTRFAPSPTGFLHIGGLFAALVSKRVAEESGGTFYLRIEDTDKKREIDDGVSEIIKGLKAFGVTPDEGVLGFEKESGEYGPYVQSKRREIYQTYAKELIRKGLAYPCFCGADYMESIKAQQDKEKVRTGYYGKWTRCRNLTLEQVKEKLDAGESYVLRLRSPGSEENRISFVDGIKGKIEMPENDMDIVILKSDGIPTYHFAHAVDDHLMGTTDVVRGDEWISSAPIHLQLFELLGFEIPQYSHISPIMKEDGGGKRKLSKRKDPEAAVTFYHEQGYPTNAVTEYLLTLANSNYEEWRRDNPTLSNSEFPFSLDKMSVSGALFDLDKFNDVAKNDVTRYNAEEIYNFVTEWAKQYNEPLYKKLTDNPSYAKAIFAIERGGEKPRKDIAKWSDIEDYTAYFYEFEPTYEDMPEIGKENISELLTAYKEIYKPEDNNEEWFAKLKELALSMGYAKNPKEYKKNPESYKGAVSDFATAIRVAVTDRRNTPDLCAIMQVLGEKEALLRIDKAIEWSKK